MIDSCVLLDIFNDDENWYQWSVETAFETSKDFKLVINPTIFTEIAYNFETCEELERKLNELNVEILGLPLQAAFNVSRVFKKHKRNKGVKNSPMPDFYIGAHASFLNAPVITRDTSRFKTYQPDVKLISPKSN